VPRTPRRNATNAKATRINKKIHKMNSIVDAMRGLVYNGKKFLVLRVKSRNKRRKGRRQNKPLEGSRGKRKKERKQARKKEMKEEMKN
jgi:hypothetical protein